MKNLAKDFMSFMKSRMTSRYSAAEQIIARGGYMSPTILEERQLNVTSMDVFSRLMMDRVIFFGTDFNSDSCNIAVSQLLYLDSCDPGKDITLYINSPGGEVYSGLGVIDTMNHIKSSVGTINTGMAASMGAMLLMSGEKGKRMSLPHARTMIHQPLGGARGQASDILIEAEQIKIIKDELYEIIQKTTGQPLDKIIADADRDYWMRAKEALDYGIIDKIV